MVHHRQLKIGASSLLLAATSLMTPAVFAFDYSVSGFVRQEMAYKINNQQNPNNANGNTVNDKPVRNIALDDTGACLLLDGLALISQLQGNTVPGSCIGGTLPEMIVRDGLDQENDWNVFATRVEIDTNLT